MILPWIVCNDLGEIRQFGRRFGVTSRTVPVSIRIVQLLDLKLQSNNFIIVSTCHSLPLPPSVPHTRRDTTCHTSYSQSTASRCSFRRTNNPNLEFTLPKMRFLSLPPKME